MLKCNNRGLAT
jgi:hypothetical protein